MVLEISIARTYNIFLFTVPFWRTHSMMRIFRKKFIFVIEVIYIIKVIADILEDNAKVLFPSSERMGHEACPIYSFFNVHGSVHRKNILICIQQDATLHSLFYLEAALHVSGGTTTHHQERKQVYLQHLVFVTPLLLPAAIMEELELVRVCCGWRTPTTAHSNQFQLFHDSDR